MWLVFGTTITMPYGPGKYDDVCTVVRETTNATGAIVIVLNGNQGSGFSCQILSQKISEPALVKLLRHVADEIDPTDKN